MSTTYTCGKAAYQSPHARVETKPSGWSAGRRDTSGGYERIRSWEHDPTQPGEGKRDVYAYVHRLCAVAWCYPADTPVGEILHDLHGKDVHHESGVEWDNREGNLEVMDHGRHSEVTQAQMRAWSADAKRSIEDDAADPEDACAECGATDATFARSESFDGLRCLECAMAHPTDEPLEVV